IPVGAGVRALGMGNAFTAIADDATAATWNPAGMTILERPELSFSLGYYRQDVSATGRDGGSDGFDLDHVSGVLPFHVFGFQQTVALAWQREFDFNSATSFASQQTIGSIITDSSVESETTGALSSWGLSYGIAVSSVLSFGVTAKVWDDELTGNSTHHTDYSQQQVTDNSGLVRITRDSTVGRDTSVAEGYSFVIGAMWQPAAQWTLAGVFKPGFDLRQHEDLAETTSVLVESSFGGPSLTEAIDSGTASSTFAYPDSLAVAVAWRPSDLDTLALDVVWTAWSQFAVERDGERSSPLGGGVAPESFDDDYALRLGYERLFILPRWVLVGRAGISYERLPGLEPLSDLDSATVEEIAAGTDEWWGLSCGVSAIRRRYGYDLGLQVRRGSDVGTNVQTSAADAADVTTLTVRGGVSFLF
nr:outer membrane protein transport protein [Planctomycetota bacterium]